MSSERISPQTREDFEKIQRSTRRSKVVWAGLVGGVIATGVSVLFFHGEYVRVFGVIDVITTAWQFTEGRIQEANAGHINKRGDADLERAYGSLAEPLAISEARMVVKLERVDRSVTRPFAGRKFRRDSEK